MLGGHTGLNSTHASLISFCLRELGLVQDSNFDQGTLSIINEAWKLEA
jgi:hypothetical protein